VAGVEIQTRTLHLLKLQISMAVTHQRIQHVRMYLFGTLSTTHLEWINLKNHFFFTIYGTSLEFMLDDQEAF